MKKIAILATYVGVVDRGAETFVIELSKSLMENYQIDVYSTGINNEIKDCMVKVEVEKGFFLKIHEFCYDNNKIYRKFCNRLYWIIPDVLFQKKFTKKVFEEYINNAKYDLIFPNNGIWGAVYARKLRALEGIPYIYTGHGGIGKGENLILQEKPNFYIALTNRHEVWAKTIYDNVKKISNGIDCEKFSEHTLNVMKKDNIVIMVAAFTAFKRHKLAIDAVSLLQDFSLICLGKGELCQEILKYGQEKLGNRFEIKSVPYEKIKSYYSKAKIFTLPSKDEPFGIVYLEAMAMGLPIVAPNDMVRREIVGQAGILCDCENPKIYAKAIFDAAQMEWGTKPQQQALRFSWKMISEKYKEIIEKLI